ncbi:heptosyltransferase-1 [Cricetibacter osteomyelitidis]|uniref:Lipopolysaccharide heptosyltransferase 1 n=2 Tax=Cricetibacter osteomyelitidis TaxID=1521931 RepID=A0A4R2T0T3_9PAST|nr:heptosyltransferase-1 [Cricetibacter osteomyelitidis]
MGDVLHTLPALTDAQQAIPDLQVDWVVEPYFAEIPLWHLAVNQIIPIALRRWRKSPFSAQTRNEWKTYRTLLQQNQYDAVIDAQGLIKSAFFATRLAQGVKHGYDKHSIREPWAAWWYDKKYAISYQQHAVERVRQLFAQALNYPLPQIQGNYGIAEHFQIEKNVLNNNVHFVLFFHGTTRTDKFWSDDHWRKLAEKLTALGVQVRVPWYSDSEKQRAEMIVKELDNAVILPLMNISELAQQIAQSKAVVSVDTGMAHLTAALDKPNITLYGATDPRLVGTYGKHQIHLKADSMAEISVESVWEQFIINNIF